MDSEDLSALDLSDSASSSDEEFEVIHKPKSRHATQPKVPGAFHTPLCLGHEIFEISVDELQHLYSSRDLTAQQYIEFCLERIRRTNPYLEFVIETNPDAPRIARCLDEERSNGKLRGPLHGVPVLIKDNIATADKMETTAGSWALLGCKVPKDAHIVSLLRKAGAVILGKSNLDEWAGMRTSKYSCGFSARGGQCRNVYDLRRSPNGSSSGSAVAVSANVVPLAFGTETDCSLISPGMVNGVCSIKPTVGLTSRGGVIPISETQDSVGHYGRCIADVVRALDVIAVPDPDDKHSTIPGRRQPVSFYECLADRHALNGARFGLPVVRFWDQVPLPQRQVAERIVELITQAGASVVLVDMPCAEERMRSDGEWDWERYANTKPEISELTVSKVETYYLMKEYLSKLKNTSMKSLEDIIRFNDENSGSEGGHAGDLAAFPDGQNLFRKCVATKGIKDATYFKALKHIQLQCRENGIDAALRGYNSDKYNSNIDINGSSVTRRPLDALLFCDIKQGGIQIAAQAGYPVISIPIGLDPENMPIALTLQHTAWQEDLLVKWASAIEDLLRHHNEAAMGGGEGLLTGQTSKTIPQDVNEQRRKMLGRVPPTFRNHLCKNIPPDREYNY